MHVRCPHCHNPIEVLDDASLSDVSCPSCGSGFSLIGDTTETLERPDSAAPPVPPLDAQPSIAHFQLAEKLGTGAFGTVWRAVDRQLDRTVAIKVPRHGGFTDGEAEQFLREARAAAQLKHPNIVAVHEVGRENGRIYIVSDFVRGETLAERLTAGPLGAREAAELCALVADALQHAHEVGVIHRDLKPANIMLDEQDRPYVMDFGLAKREAAEITMTVHGQLLGTPAYMSPEQAKGDARDADARSDVYSMGVILFELLTAERPFRGNLRMLLEQVIHEPAPSPRHLDGTIPRDLETICLKCLAKEPSRRYATSRELSDDLRRFLQGRPILARPVSRSEKSWRWCKRNPVVASLSAAVGVVLIAGTIVSTTFAIVAGRERDRADVEAATATHNKDVALTEAGNARRAEADARTAQERAESELTRAENLLYISQISGAYREWIAGNAQAAWNQLNASRRDLRRWEHDLLNTLFTNNQRTYRVYESAISSVSFSPDDARVVTIGGRFSRIWDARSGQVLRTIGTQEQGLGTPAVAFDSSGQRFISGGFDKTVKLWNAETGELLRTMEGHCGPVNCVAFHPVDNVAVSGSDDRTLRLWDLTTGEQIREFTGHTGVVRGIQFDASGTRMVSGADDKSVRLWDVETGELIHPFDGHGTRITGVAINASGTTIVSASVEGAIKIWDVGSASEIRTLDGNAGEVQCVAISRQDDRIVSGAVDGALRIWDINSGQLLATLKGHTAAVMSAAFNSDGSQIASSSYNGELKLWDVAGRPNPALLDGHENSIRRIAFSPDGTIFATASYDGTVKLWRSESLQHLRTIVCHIRASVDGVVFTPTSSQLVTKAGLTMQLWDAESGDLVRTFDDQVGAFAVSPDGAFIVGSGRDDTLKLWDIETGQQVLDFEGGIRAARSIAFSANGDWIVASGSGASLTVWEARTGKRLRELPLRFSTSSLADLVVNSDSSLIVMNSSGNDIHLLDATTGQEIKTLVGHTGAVTGVGFDRQADRIVSSSHDKSVKIWDVQSGREILSLATGTGMTNCVALRPDNKQIVAASNDGRLISWMADETQHPRILATNSTNAFAHAFDSAVSPDGAMLASGYNYALRVVSTETGREIFGHSLDSSVMAVAWRPGGRQVLAARTNPLDKFEDLAVWSAETGELEFEIPSAHAEPAEYVSPDGKIRMVVSPNAKYAQRLTYSQDGKYFASSAMHVTNLWDAASGRRVLSFVHGTLATRDVAISPKSDRIVMGSAPPFDAARVISIESGETACTLEAEKDSIVHKVSFDRDGQQIIGFCDGELAVWDASGKQVRRVVLDTPETAAPGFFPGQPGNVIFSPDRRLIVGAHAENGLCFWDADSGEVLSTFVTGTQLTEPNFASGGREVIFLTQGNTIQIYGVNKLLRDNAIKHRN